MSSETLEVGPPYIRVVADIVSAYVSKNHVALSDLPGLIANVYDAISALTDGENVGSHRPEREAEKPTPAKIRKSITPDALISFIDGKPYSTLKRHLTKHGLNADSYRAQYGLPMDYPMVAPSYSEKRSALAKFHGLGSRTGRNAKAEPPKPARKGRKKGF